MWAEAVNEPAAVSGNREKKMPAGAGEVEIQRWRWWVWGGKECSQIDCYYYWIGPLQRQQQGLLGLAKHKGGVPLGIGGPVLCGAVAIEGWG